MADKPYTKGRGAQLNPANRFLKRRNEVDVEHQSTEEEKEALLSENPATRYIDVYPKSIINKVESSDLPDFSLNPYQGCEHGCVYCYARNTHEYWGFSAGADFEQNILVKRNAPELLQKELSNPKWQAATIMLAGNTDIYQPVERKLEITRQLLEVFWKFRHPVGMITKNSLIERDIDLLEKLASERLVNVLMSLTTLDESLKRLLEPRTSTAKNVLKTIERLTASGIPVRVLTAPIIPSINDHEIPALVKAVADAGAEAVSYQVVRLNGQVALLFEDWLRKNFPDRADKVLNQIRSIHGGQLNDSRFGVRMRGEGLWAEMIRKQFQLAHTSHFKDRKATPLNMDLHAHFKGGQLKLF
ncbi:MAG: hypothetical protein RLZZ543_256 [Bacteroidota bacterium]